MTEWDDDWDDGPAPPVSPPAPATPAAPRAGGDGHGDGGSTPEEAARTARSEGHPGRRTGSASSLAARAPAPSVVVPAAAQAMPPPRPETVRAALQQGQVVWAQVAGSTARLSSGAEMAVAGVRSDGLDGWRAVKVIDPTSLLVEVVPIDGEPLAEIEADDPTSLWPERPPQDLDLDRPETFPVGLGKLLVRKDVFQRWLIITTGAGLLLAAISGLMGIVIGKFLL